MESLLSDSTTPGRFRDDSDATIVRLTDNK